MSTPETSPLLLEETKISVKPLVLFHILDHHSRRQEERVIGTLLGRKDGTNIEITNAFAVPHAERGEEVAIGKDFNKKMLNMVQKTSKETVVGWYATTNDSIIADTSALIHEFYAGECDDADPVHLVIDTRLEQDQLFVKAFKSSALILQNEIVGNVFHEVQVQMESTDAERICLREMIEPSDLNDALEHLEGLLDSTLAYVQDVIDGKTKPNPEQGRLISDALASIPRTGLTDTKFHDNLQDLLMVTYLSNLARTQIEIAEKLNASLGMV